MSIEQRAKQLLKDKGWTQKRLAEAIGTHPVYLSNFLAAKIGRETVYEKLETFLVDSGYPPAREQPDTPNCECI